MTNDAPARRRTGDPTLDALLRDNPNQYLDCAACSRVQAATFGGRRPHPSKWSRCASNGVVGRDGSIVKLRVAKIGRRIATTPTWLAEFFAAAGATTEAA